MGAWRTITFGMLCGCLLTSGCQSQPAPGEPLVFPAPPERTLVIRTMQPPARPVPATQDDSAPRARLDAGAKAQGNAAAKPQAAVDEVVDPNAWIDAMKKVHAGFSGTKGYVALLGDSITYADPFWTPLEFTDPAPYLAGATDGLPTQPKDKPWKHTIKGLRAKGLEHCNGSGWQVNYILRTIDAMIEREKPEVAILMVGTNDVGNKGKMAPGWQDQYERIVRKCLDANCIPILNTIPPRRDRDETVEEANTIIRNVAAKYRVPLVDFHAEMVRRRPGKTVWGTLMQNDGLHPTANKTNIFTDENLNDSGYALRTWMNFLAYREIYFRVLHPEQVEPAKSAKR